MGKIELVVFFLQLFIIVPIFFQIIDALTFIQKNKYNLKKIFRSWSFSRLKTFFPSGRFSMFFVILILILIYLFWSKYYFLSLYFFVFYLFLYSFFIFLKIYFKKIEFPKLTFRTLLIEFLTLFLVLGILYLGYTFEHFLLALFFLLLFSYYLVFVVFILFYPFFWFLQYIFLLEISKKLKKDNTKIILITGIYGKSTFKYFLKQLLSAQNVDAKYCLQNFFLELGNLNTLLNLGKTDYLILDIGEVYSVVWKLFCKLFKVDYLIITSLGGKYFDKSIKSLFVKKVFADKSFVKNIKKIFVGEKIDINLSINLENYKEEKVFGIKILEKKGSGKKVEISQKNQKIIFETELASFDLEILKGALFFLYKLGFDIDLEKLKNVFENLIKPSGILEKRQRGKLLLINDIHTLSLGKLVYDLEYLFEFEGKKFLILDDILLGEKNLKKINYLLGKKLASLKFEKIFLLGDFFVKYIENGYLEAGGKKEKIYYKNQLPVLLGEEGVVLLAGPKAKEFLKI